MPRNSVAPPLVCVLGMRGIPGVMGGVKSHCEELLPRVQRRAPYLRFVALGRKPYIGNEKRTFNSIEVVPLPSPRRQSTETLVSSFLGVCYARFIGASAVHIHALASGLYAPLAKLLGMKVILTIHGADYQRAKWGWSARALLRLGEMFGVNSADAVICVAPSLTKDLQRRYPKRASRIAFVPNGAPPIRVEGSEQALLDEFGLERGKFILAVGRLEPGKGFELLIDAFQKSAIGNKLVIVGGAQHDPGYASNLMRSKSDCVIFAGVQPRALLGHLYKSAALFVLPSLHEGLPICALEAGLSGCPLLLSDIPGNRDLGLPEWHYFASSDAKALAKALEAPVEQYRVSSKSFSSFDWRENLTPDARHLR